MSQVMLWHFKYLTRMVMEITIDEGLEPGVYVAFAPLIQYAIAAHSAFQAFCRWHFKITRLTCLNMSIVRITAKMTAAYFDLFLDS